MEQDKTGSSATNAEAPEAGDGGDLVQDAKEKLGDVKDKLGDAKVKLLGDESDREHDDEMEPRDR